MVFGKKDRAGTGEEDGDLNQDDFVDLPNEDDQNVEEAEVPVGSQNRKQSSGAHHNNRYMILPILSL